MAFLIVFINYGLLQGSRLIFLQFPQLINNYCSCLSNVYSVNKPLQRLVHWLIMPRVTEIWRRSFSFGNCLPIYQQASKGFIYFITFRLIPSTHFSAGIRKNLQRVIMTFMLRCEYIPELTIFKKKMVFAFLKRSH